MKAIFRPQPLIRKISLDATDPDTKVRRGIYTEWIVTNGLGGYASGTVGGVNTRRFHGWLIAALPAPHGRMMMVNNLRERFYIGEKQFVLDCEDFAQSKDDSPPAEHDCPPTEAQPISPYLHEVWIENGLPVWVYHLEDVVLEKRVCMVHAQNTTCIRYTLLQGSGRIEVQPAIHVRHHEGSLEGPAHGQYRFTSVEHGFELFVSNDIPILKFHWAGNNSGFHMLSQQIVDIRYRVEEARGYDWKGGLWSPGLFSAELNAIHDASLTLSTEDWERLQSISPADSFRIERERKRRLLRSAPEAAHAGFNAELVLAADQFLITPLGRTADQVRAHAVGDEIRSVIAGYHWFTDWGRDTMISLEGLTLSTGRTAEAGYILRAFSNYIRNGLIPNLFPEGKTSGLYHTADATLWFFHAIDRYLAYTGDSETLEELLPKLIDIIEWHIRGTDFGIGVDPGDGLLRQGAAGYQLTWMDAKVGDWVVTPRRGKAVEINALWYNALRLTCEWLESLDRKDIKGNDTSAITSAHERYLQMSNRAYASFQSRFWNPATNCLFDVVDSPQEKDGRTIDDPAVRPNQVISFSLKYPVLAPEKWKPVLEVVHRELLTPVGLRSLSPRDKDYKPKYDGDLWARDAAYHQGTVWAWLIGPFIDAWRRAWPEDLDSLRTFLSGFEHHFSEEGVGTISEIFDAEPPFRPRGCIAQAWSVAEVLRCQLLIETANSRP